MVWGSDHNIMVAISVVIPIIIVAKYDASIPAMHWHRLKSTFLLEQFFNSEKSNQDHNQIKKKVEFTFYEVVCRILTVVHHGEDSFVPECDFKRMMKNTFILGSPCQWRCTGLYVLLAFGQGVEQI